jgi:hypothetical protein
MSVEVLLTVARRLGIVITQAPADSEVFECWADRVALARVYARRGDRKRLARAVDEANRYAVA